MWTKEEDELIWKLQDNLGNKWKFIASQLNDKNGIQVAGITTSTSVPRKQY